MSAVLEKEVVISMGPVVVDGDSAYMTIPAGTHTIQIPLPNNGSIGDINASIQMFWDDLLSSSEVQKIFKVHNVKVKND